MSKGYISLSAPSGHEHVKSIQHPKNLKPMLQFQYVIGILWVVPHIWLAGNGVGGGVVTNSCRESLDPIPGGAVRLSGKGLH